jgi:hypothetical protein
MRAVARRADRTRAATDDPAQANGMPGAIRRRLS